MTTTKSNAVAPVTRVFPISEMHWETSDPFLFCAHHRDDYPAGDERMAPVASLAGRDIGSDFAGKDGWNMYHGQTVPGFPAHPHRGFETVTIARKGFIDHSDSLGATARFGQGDVQWMTAGKGIVHCEMFPLVARDTGNPAELFQIWLNLPRKHKLVDPHFTMLWSDDIATAQVVDEAGAQSHVRVIAGDFGETQAPKPPPKSWAADPANGVAIWAIEMAPGARLVLPAVAIAGLNRTLYFFAGAEHGGWLEVGGQRIDRHAGVTVGDGEVILHNRGATAVELLFLQGRPIGEAVAKYGPFVMNTPEEIQQAMIDYRRTQFGGWPWGKDDPVHPADRGRFALHADGRKEAKP